MKINKEQIKLFLTDVDGVLTDGGMYYTENGDEFKKFCVYDGMGMKLLQATGIKVGIITAEDRQLNRRRATKLQLDFDYHGIKDKLSVVKNLCQELNIELGHVAYIGDDINDKELLEAVGLSACPSNAIPEIKSIPKIILLQKSGGDGAVREYAEIILHS